MCDASFHDTAPIRAIRSTEDMEPGSSTAETLPLEPVEAVTITTLVDNVADVLLQDTGPARRPKRDRVTVAVATME